MDEDILFETNRFNLSEVQEHFINPCCFGEDLARWLRAELMERGLEVDEPGQEDWGWYLRARRQGCWYFVGVGGNADEASGEKNQGEWRIMVEEVKWGFSPSEMVKAVWGKLTGKKEECDKSQMKKLIREIIEAEPDVRNVRYGA